MIGVEADRLRRVRVGTALWRYWRAWSLAPPPMPLRALLDRLWQGQGIYLYVYDRA